MRHSTCIVLSSVDSPDTSRRSGKADVRQRRQRPEEPDSTVKPTFAAGRRDRRGGHRRRPHGRRGHGGSAAQARAPAVRLLVAPGRPPFSLVPHRVPARQNCGLGYPPGLALLRVTLSWMQVLGVGAAVLLVTFRGVGLVWSASHWPWSPRFAVGAGRGVLLGRGRVRGRRFASAASDGSGSRTPQSILPRPAFPLIGVASASFVVACLGQPRFTRCSAPPHCGVGFRGPEG